jgi:hypothetical protein
MKTALKPDPSVSPSEFADKQGLASAIKRLQTAAITGMNQPKPEEQL